MMNVNVHSLDGNRVEQVELPKVFSTPYRVDLVRRAFVHLQSRYFQPQGRDPLAGMRVSAESRGTGLGIARMARVKGEGMRRAGQAGGVAGVVKGRLTHPPRAEKIIVKRLNKKERHLALCSALAATAIREVVRARGHRIPDDIELPLVVTDEIEGIGKAKDLLKVLKALRLSDDLERARGSIRKRSGKARMRGRRQYIAKSALIVVKGANSSVARAAGSIPGVEVVPVDRLSVLHLAPGGHPGRLCIWSKSALEGIRDMSNGAVEFMEVTAL
ncbi:MAG: 50S ribosomal protein L4 [Candidatus Nitrosocaldus sp.]|nr:50S ribosomal protein L4 [Candidatus Nitrosocaldus sp.]MDW8275511.1 50S ribosomal protein L4 [Candidatus Nitrosocaldus sp.]